MNQRAAWFGWMVIQKGSDTSGNWLHRGRRGKHGGSASGGGHGAMGVADASPSEIKDEVARRREARAKKQPPEETIAKGDYVKSKKGNEFGGQVGEMDYYGKPAYKVRNRVGDVYGLLKSDAKKITKEQAIKQGLESEKPVGPSSAPPKKLPKGASFYAQTSADLGSEFKFKLQLVNEAFDRLKERIKSGKVTEKKGSREVLKLTKLTEAIKEEYNRINSEFKKAEK